jgi:type III pantothenate kinase
LNLCIDIGNTSAKTGIFELNDLLEVKYKVSDRGILKMVTETRPENVLISSVRKGIGKIVEKTNRISNTIVLDHQTPVPIESQYQTKHTLGVDRVASVVGAKYLYPVKNCLVIDLGTCITYDLVDEAGIHHGGGISPGLEMRSKAMHKFTSKLPLISMKGSPDLIGKTTKECMQSGVINGATAELEGIIERYRQLFHDLVIIFCGGDAIFFESKIKDHIFAIPNLVLTGLNQILRFNLNV